MPKERALASALEDGSWTETRVSDESARRMLSGKGFVLYCQIRNSESNRVYDVFCTGPAATATALKGQRYEGEAGLRRSLSWSPCYVNKYER